VARRLAQLLGCRCAQEGLAGRRRVLPGEVVLLENVRFNKGEKKDADDLAQKMAALCDVYVMDAFGTAHRAEASTHGVAKYAPVACAGPLLVSELSALETALREACAAALAIVAGSKVSTKLTVLESLLGKVDQLIVAAHHQHLFGGVGLQCRQVLMRARHAGHLQTPARAVEQARHRHTDAHRRGRRHGVFREGGGRREVGRGGVG